MKDAKGHGSDPRGGSAAHQTGVDMATARSTMKLLMEDAKAKGVNLELEDMLRPNDWHLAYIERESGPPGSGATVIRNVQAAADKLGAQIRVEPMGNSKELHTYYKKLGFRDTGERGEEGEPHMIRKPGGKS